MDPLALLRGLLDTTEDAARALVGRERIRLAVTGLSRAGKTVFLTSLVANLLAAGRGARTLPALSEAAGGRIRRVFIEPAGTETVPRFDPEAHLAALAADPPRWPERTEDFSTLSIAIDVERRTSLGGLLPERRVTLDLIDYPGEWLLDLPLLRQDFATWSAATLARLRAWPAAATTEFLAFLDALPAGAPAEDALAKRGHTLYRDMLRACRDTHGLRFLQPGRFLNPGPRGDAPLLWFFPLPAGARGGLADLCARRYAAYLDDQRATFLDPFFSRFHRQVVLVDVLGALHAGEAAFRDTAEALAAVAEVISGASWLERLLGAAPGRVAFAATKADHVPTRARDALAALLDHIALGARGRAEASGAVTTCHAVAAIRCTEDAVATLEGQALAAVRGLLLNGGQGATIYPGEVPMKPPEPAFWDAGFFRMPDFQPPRLDPAGGSGVPHLGLDALLAWLIGDAL
ncbi:YcjX family protein [Roseomonas sp. PWR1]|uniref:YcjX family protein n=1 Tax=Roseomonas nitratireducens TaxID=2820810 RepID=A0ABS4AVX9_9PROT|nr:YcjX family protein [Neoroseomonas nitratireducens]MBP0465510.1 YcjX family protein [Neoroseomonas nitratireducens]